MEQERRKFKRYDVSSIAQVTARAAGAEGVENLLALSQGGCGVWVPAEVCQYQPEDSLDMEICWGPDESQKGSFRGVVLYLSSRPLEGELGFIYGVRFDDKSTARMAEVIRFIEDNYQPKEQPYIKASTST